MQCPALSKNGDNIGFSREQCLKRRVIFGRISCLPRRTKSHDFRLLKRSGFDDLKELDIFRIGSWPPPFDEMHAQFIQFEGDSDLILDRKAYIFGLRTISQGRIIDFNC